MFVGDAVFSGEVYSGTRCPMFVGDAVFPAEVHRGTRCPMFVYKGCLFPGEVHLFICGFAYIQLSIQPISHTVVALISVMWPQLLLWSMPYACGSPLV